MISPGAIPQFTGDFEQLDKDASALQSDAIGIRDGGADVHSRFQALAAFYEAPEAEELFATTRPVMDGADTFATKLETVAGALQTYAAEARPQADRLEQLKTQAFAFVESVEDDDDWTEDEGKVERHKALMDGVAAAQAAFQEAERRAANTISALVGGPRFVEDNGDHTVDDKTVMYGYGLDRLQHAEELPWGTPEERTYERWSLGWWGHGVKSFVWDGLIIDNIGGALDGLWTLVGGHGWGKAGDAWSGLGDVFGGISAYIMTPYDWAMDQVFGPAPPDATTERQKKALREFGKGLVAWDQWGDDPARASATVVFNFGTLFLGPAAAASKAGKGGAAAKTAANVAKVIDHLDPVAAGIKAAGKVASHLPKLSELPSRLLPASRLAEDGTPGVHTIVEAPDGSYVRIEDGEFVQYDKNGHRVESEAPTEQSPERQPATTPAPHREPAMVGARPRTPEAHAHVADDAGTTPGRTDPAGHTRGHETEGAGTGPARTGDGPAVPPARSGGGGGHGIGGDGHGLGIDGDGLDDAVRTRGSGDGTGTRGGDGTGTPAPVTRPPYMREGPNPYPEHATAEQIKEIQVYRANHEPGYFEKYYNREGDRLHLTVHDESGRTPVQLHVDPETKVKRAASDAPPPIGEKYVDEGAKRGDRAGALDDKTLEKLDEAAAERQKHIDAATEAEKKKQHLVNGGDPEALRAAQQEAKEAMASRTKAAEQYGETVAAVQVIPEHYPGSTRMTLHGPANGNDQFDQVWKKPDGGYVVVEAKSAVSTELGSRKIAALEGDRAMQGTRDYFMDILEQMDRRGNDIPSEGELAAELRQALIDGNVEYILVKGKVDGPLYAGYEKYQFELN
ncbi:hypothetical protein [Streptomyces evansiae]|uniref:hypothetical protein n=1 Tax=Streptomyces evansiae TaxID=3075535 RepID=UPI0028863719|nr:hypothetical protein [Streptomyces sp. DSM 41859]MDT0425148.1 hypothetical protein [Streptomyces sp. DSM 41859]